MLEGCSESIPQVGPTIEIQPRKAISLCGSSVGIFTRIVTITLDALKAVLEVFLKELFSWKQIGPQGSSDSRRPLTLVS